MHETNATNGTRERRPPPSARRRQSRRARTWGRRAAKPRGRGQLQFGYDDSKQLTSAKQVDTSNTVLQSLTYGYDNAGNRVQAGTGTTAPKNYAVNNVNQLLSERDFGATTFAGYVDEPATVKVNGQPAKVMSTDGGAPYHFEALVNLDAGANTVTVEAKDGRNNAATNTYAVTTTGTSTNFEYDATGNLRYEKQPDGTVIREYRWDQQNRLVKALIGTHESDYAYDGQSRRVRITELESGVQTKDETFVWCGWRLCQKRSGSTVERNYFEQGFEDGTTVYLYTRDHLGSVREAVNSDGTTVSSRLSYDPWGKITQSGSGAVSDFAFTGHHYDRASGLSLTWHRGYDLALGRWLSMDPIGIIGGLNLYAYVTNNPVKSVDSTGLSADEPKACDVPNTPCHMDCIKKSGDVLNKCEASGGTHEVCIQKALDASYACMITECKFPVVK